MFRAMHGHLANFSAYNSKHHVDTVFDHFTTMLVSLFFLQDASIIVSGQPVQVIAPGVLTFF